MLSRAPGASVHRPPVATLSSALNASNEARWQKPEPAKHQEFAIPGCPRLVRCSRAGQMREGSALTRILPVLLSSHQRFLAARPHLRARLHPLHHPVAREHVLHCPGSPPYWHWTAASGYPWLNRQAGPVLLHNPQHCAYKRRYTAKEVTRTP